MKRVFRDNIRTLFFKMLRIERVLALDEMPPSPMRDALVEMHRRFEVVEAHFREVDAQDAHAELHEFGAMMRRLMRDAS